MSILDTNNYTLPLSTGLPAQKNTTKDVLLSWCVLRCHQSGFAIAAQFK